LDLIFKMLNHKDMKQRLPSIIAILLVFIFTYHIITSFVIKNNLHKISNSNQIKNSKQINYSDGEYQKERKRWEKQLKEVYEKIIINMTIPYEQLVVQNYIQYGIVFTKLNNEMMKIETSSNFNTIHTNLIKEVQDGAILCNSYMNDITKFDTNFKNYFLIHQQNIKPN
jgi:L-lactate permease